MHPGIPVSIAGAEPLRMELIAKHGAVLGEIIYQVELGKVTSPFAKVVAMLAAMCEKP